MDSFHCIQLHQNLSRGFISLMPGLSYGSLKRGRHHIGFLYRGAEMMVFKTGVVCHRELTIWTK